MRSQKPEIVAQKLRKVYNGDFVAVSDLSFEVSQGMCFGLLGRNGNYIFFFFDFVWYFKSASSVQSKAQNSNGRFSLVFYSILT